MNSDSTPYRNPDGTWRIPQKLIEKVGATNVGPLRAYRFLRHCAESGAEFTYEDLGTAAGWKGTTPKTYKSKQWGEFVDRVGKGRYRVNSRFSRITVREFFRNFTQSRKLLGEYHRTVHRHVIEYEFLLPLAREKQLRRALDSLFYRDSLSQRIREAGTARFEQFFARDDAEADAKYIDRICDEVGALFAGYSVFHVNGRFRSQLDAGIVSRAQAGSIISAGGEYLIDETTAIVRFIVPCNAGSGEFSDVLGEVSDAIEMPDTDFLTTIDVGTESRTIRELFLALFAEAAVDTVQGEDEIWLVENSPTGQRLFRWTAKHEVDISEADFLEDDDHP